MGQPSQFGPSLGGFRYGVLADQLAGITREQVSSLLLGNRTCEQKTTAYCYSGRREEWEEGFDFVSFDNM